MAPLLHRAAIKTKSCTGAYRVHNASTVAAVLKLVVTGVETQRLHYVGAGAQKFSV